MAKWLLVETFGPGEPSVIGVGNVPKKMLPLRTVLGRGHSLSDVADAVAAVHGGHEGLRRTLAGGRRVIADPLRTAAGDVHGAWVWTGHAEEPPHRDRAGAWAFNLTTDRITVSDDLLDLNGVAAEGRHYERYTAEAFLRLLTNADESQALAKLVRAEPGTEHQATWTIRRDDGQTRAGHFSCRMLAQPQADGSRHVILRGITHDLGPAETHPGAAPPLVLAQQVLAGLAEPGTHRTIINLRTLRILRWLDEPMPGLVWTLDDNDAPHWIHPDDLAKAQAMTEGLARGKTSADLRFRADDGWRRLHVTAHLVLLDHTTTAALLTLYQQTSS